jgi:phosphinothricin acetyltransferase
MEPSPFSSEAAMPASFVLDAMTLQDWPKVRAIFGEGLATGIAAFRKTPPVWRDWDAGHLPFARLVARGSDGRVLGWGALAPVADS